MATRSALIERIYGTRDLAWEAWRVEQLRVASQRAKRSPVKAGLLYALRAHRKTPSSDRCLRGTAGVPDPQGARIRDA